MSAVATEHLGPAGETERRRAPRAGIRLPVQIFSGGHYYMTRTVDFSRFGMRVPLGTMGADRTIVRVEAYDIEVRTAARRIRPQAYEFLCRSDGEIRKLNALFHLAVEKAVRSAGLKILLVGSSAERLATLRAFVGHEGSSFVERAASPLEAFWKGQRAWDRVVVEPFEGSYSTGAAEMARFFSSKSAPVVYLGGDVIESVGQSLPRSSSVTEIAGALLNGCVR